MHRTGVILASIHLALVGYIVFIILSGQESSWALLWWLFWVLDFPVCIGIYVFNLFSFPTGTSPLTDITNFWIPALYFGIVGTWWWYYVGANITRYLNWIRNKH